jgi:bis(5'-nucleosyl)-tetraphosphatase (symmetrical)
MNSLDNIFAVGDVQGCHFQLKQLIKKLPKNSKIICMGDLVNRGPDSLKVLRTLKSLQEAGQAECILGNHDLHLLARDAGIRGPKSLDTLDAVLKAPDRKELIHWLRHRPMVLYSGKDSGNTLLVHAGILPQWDVTKTLELAHELEKVLRHKNYAKSLIEMYGNTPNQWHDRLKGAERHRVIINSLTRLRFCSARGVMEFESKEGAGAAPNGYKPWFEVTSRKTQDAKIVFGHWSTLGLLKKKNVVGLDTGCVWGGQLTAMSLGKRSDFIQVTGLRRPIGL